MIGGMQWGPGGVLAVPGGQRRTFRGVLCGLRRSRGRLWSPRGSWGCLGGPKMSGRMSGGPRWSKGSVLGGEEIKGYI